MLTLLLSFALAQSPPAQAPKAPTAEVLTAAGVPESVRALTWVSHTQIESKKRVQPKFPQSAKDAALPAAKCVTYVHIDTEGKVAGSWATDCPNVFKDTTVEAMARWTWKPPMVDGKPADVLTTIGMSYRIQ